MAAMEKLKLPDGTVSLQRNVQLRYSPTESGVGDHMIVQHVTGNEDNVVVTKAGGTRKVRRVVMHMDIATSSTPAMPAMTGSHFSLEDVDEDDERRLLAVYDMFPKEAA